MTWDPIGWPVRKGYTGIGFDKMESKMKDEKELDIQLEETMKTFLVDYADLIGQLKPEDHIMVTTKSNKKLLLIMVARPISKREWGDIDFTNRAVTMFPSMYAITIIPW